MHVNHATLRLKEVHCFFCPMHSTFQAHICDAVYFRSSDFASRVAGGDEDEVVEHRAGGRARIVHAQDTEASL